MAVSLTPGNNTIVIPAADAFSDPTAVSALVDAGLIKPGKAVTDPGVMPPIYVKSLRWVGASNAAHTCVIKDLSGVSAAGAVMYDMAAQSADHSEEVLVEEWWTRGFQVPTLGSGTLYINLG